MAAVAGDIVYYLWQMLPLGLLALLAFLLLRPRRARRLERLGLTSGPLREITLCLFILFCAGLAALTLFPANVWSYVMDLGRGWYDGASFLSFYPTWEETMAGLDHLDHMLTPFQEIRRALESMSYWLMFMLLGNIAMFVPIGFFPALLWRGWRWWKVLLLGLLTSCAIECIQFFIGRSTDIDDVILNTTGAVLGFGLYALLRALFPRAAVRFHCQDKGA